MPQQQQGRSEVNVRLRPGLIVSEQQLKAINDLTRKAANQIRDLLGLPPQSVDWQCMAVGTILTEELEAWLSRAALPNKVIGVQFAIPFGDDLNQDETIATAINLKIARGQGIYLTFRETDGKIHLLFFCFAMHAWSVVIDNITHIPLNGRPVAI